MLHAGGLELKTGHWMVGCRCSYCIARDHKRAGVFRNQWRWSLSYYYDGLEIVFRKKNEGHATTRTCTKEYELIETATDRSENKR